MIRVQEIDYVCPQCRGRNRVRLVLRVDVAENPERAVRVLDGSLFEQECFHCKAVNAMDHGLRLDDPTRRLCVWNAPPGDPFAPAIAAMVAPPADWKWRKVADMNVLHELLHIYDEGLDDAAMLLLKHLLAARILKDTGSAPVLCSFDARAQADGQEWLEYVVFPTEESAPEALRVPFGMYADLLETVAPHKDRLFPDGQWVDWDGKTAQQMWGMLQAESR